VTAQLCIFYLDVDSNGYKRHGNTMVVGKDATVILR